MSKRGTIDRTLRVEPRKTRTCVVVSNDIANRYGQAVTVVPTQVFKLARSRRTYIGVSPDPVFGRPEWPTPRW